MNKKFLNIFNKINSYFEIKEENKVDFYEFSFTKEQVLELRNAVKENYYTETSKELLKILYEVNF